MTESKAPHQIFEPDRAYRINDFARDPNRPELAKIPKAKSTIWKAVKDSTFPPPTKLSARTSVWFGRDLNRWLEEKYHQSGNAA